MTGKQRVREILTGIVATEHPWFDPEKAVDQALGSIEEVLQEEYRHGYNDNSRDCLCGGVEIPHRHLLSDGESHNIKPDINRGRWESK